MTKHQLALHGSKKKRATVDKKRIDACLHGQGSLSDAIGISPDRVADLRAQAHALYDAAKWDRCADVAQALVALGDVEPFDAVILARAYQELGDASNTAIWTSVAERMLTELELILRDMERNAAT